MRQRFFYLLVVLFLGFKGEIIGQSLPHNFTLVQTNNPADRIVLTRLIKNNLYTSIRSQAVTSGPCFTSHAFQRIEAPFQGGYTLVKKDFYNQQLSFICQKEWLFEKATTIPLRLRLGSLEYTDYLEQKPNAIKPR